MAYVHLVALGYSGSVVCCWSYELAHFGSLWWYVLHCWYVALTDHPWCWRVILFGHLGVGLSIGLINFGIVVSWVLVRSLSKFCSASISFIPFVFLLPFKACARSSMAFFSVSADDKVGCVMFLCLKKCVWHSFAVDYLLHGLCGTVSVPVRFEDTIRLLCFQPTFLVSHNSRVIVLHIPFLL